MSGKPGVLDDLLRETRLFPPSDEFRAQANLSDAGVYERADADPEGFWAEWAEELDWFEKWHTVLEWNPPHARWFLGGKLNVSHNCLDRHLGGFRRNKAALIWEGEPGDTRTFTYWDLHREVCKFANVLRGLGVRQGDRVAIYLPMIPEAAIAMLACTRIGAAHSVVFGGFSPESLSGRINDAQASAVITADWRMAAGRLRRTQGQHRRGGGGLSLGRQRDRGAAGRPAERRHTGGDAGGTRPLVPRAHGGGQRRLRARGDGRRGSALHPLYLGDDREAEGGGAHHRRVPHAGARHRPVRLRPEGGRRLLVHGRRGVGDRSQLHRLRSPRSRCDRADVRRGSRLAPERTASGSSARSTA